jgi:dihydrofolate reductase
MARLIISAATTIDGAFEAPVPEAAGGWLVLTPDSQQAWLDMWRSADAMLMGRKCYDGLSAVWPQMSDTPGMEAFAEQMNTMPKWVASRTLNGPLGWNASLLEGDLADAVGRLKAERERNLVVTGTGEFARDLVAAGLVDELWLSVSPYLWPEGPRISESLGVQRLDLISTTSFSAGVVQLCYRLRP